MSDIWFGDWRPYWSRPEPVPEETTAKQGAWESWEDTDAAKNVKEEEKKTEEEESRTRQEVARAYQQDLKDGQERNKDKRRKVKEEEPAGYGWSYEGRSGISSTAKEAKVGWTEPWAMATATPQEVTPKESPKKVGTTTSAAMQVDDGRGAGPAPSAAILVEHGRGSEASDPKVYAYARPDPYVNPSEMGQEVESDWWRSAVTRRLGETEFKKSERAFWGKYTDSNGDTNTP